LVTSFDGETVTIRQFNGTPITASVDDSCGVSADDSSVDDGYVDSDESDWTDEDDDATADVSSDDDDVDLDDEADDASCDFDDLEEDEVLTQATFEVRGGTTYLVAVEVA
jgi:hypothetical protein